MYSSSNSIFYARFRSLPVNPSTRGFALAKCLDDGIISCADCLFEIVFNQLDVRKITPQNIAKIKLRHSGLDRKQIPRTLRSSQLINDFTLVRWPTSKLPKMSTSRLVINSQSWVDYLHMEILDDFTGFLTSPLSL